MIRYYAYLKYGHLGRGIRIEVSCCVMKETRNLYPEEELVGEKMKAAFIHRANSHQYGQQIAELETLYTRGKDEYPVNLVEAFNILSRYKRPVFMKNNPKIVIQTEHENPQVYEFSSSAISCPYW